jgi:hypothetical protein
LITETKARAVTTPRILLAVLALGALTAGAFWILRDETSLPTRIPTSTRSTPCQPWIACPVADSLRSRLERAGYELEGETGSAIIARGHGDNAFYAWASSLAALRRAEPEVGRFEDEGSERIGTIEGVPIFGDNIRLSWATAHYRLWVEAGPTPFDRTPSLKQIRALVVTTRNW